jgi:hypothetical protein
MLYERRRLGASMWDLVVIVPRLWPADLLQELLHKTVVFDGYEWRKPPKDLPWTFVI